MVMIRDRPCFFRGPLLQTNHGPNRVHGWATLDCGFASRPRGQPALLPRASREGLSVHEVAGAFYLSGTLERTAGVESADTSSEKGSMAF